jgi:choline monooxygenase
LDVDPDIRQAWTLPTSFYVDPQAYRLQLERVFARSWQLAPQAGSMSEPRRVLPWTFLPGSLEEPLLFTCDEQAELRCLSNVCTHRGNLVACTEGSVRQLRCSYHGRRFSLDGRLLSMPEFEEVRGFPARSDDLPQLPLARWGPLVFVALAPACSCEEWLAPVRARVGWLDAGALVLDPAASRDYSVEAHWALYCDNYLEGFHIPYVHESLAEVLDYDTYRTELFEHCSIQVGLARAEEACFELPRDHPDHGQKVAAYYCWLFPNLMLNFYPWGLSVNIVEPQGLARTRVRFLTYVRDEAQRGQGAGTDLHRVELEDEAVVESVQRGLRSRLYRRGRFSPTRETGVHHFHRLLSRHLA